MKKCYGYFMDGKECDKCKLLADCFSKWKSNGEPRLVKPLDRAVEFKGCEKCG
jgi:hypothetical protein